MNTRQDAPVDRNGRTPLQRWKAMQPAVLERPLQSGLIALKTAAYYRGVGQKSLTKEADRLLRISTTIRHHVQRGRGDFAKQFARETYALLRDVVLNGAPIPEKVRGARG